MHDAMTDRLMCKGIRNGVRFALWARALTLRTSSRHLDPQQQSDRLGQVLLLR
jgi:hypothetical protein